jgi:hypothetical protein
MMTGRDVGGDVPSEMTGICAFLPLEGARFCRAARPHRLPQAQTVLVVQILRLVPADSPVRQPESTLSGRSLLLIQCRESERPQGREIRPASAGR